MNSKIKWVEEYPTSMVVCEDDLYVGTSKGRFYCFKHMNGRLFNHVVNDVEEPFYDLVVNDEITAYICNNQLYVDTTRLNVGREVISLDNMNEYLLATTKEETAVLCTESNVLLEVPAEKAYFHGGEIYTLYKNTLRSFNLDGEPRFVLETNNRGKVVEAFISNEGNIFSLNEEGHLFRSNEGRALATDVKFMTKKGGHILVVTHNMVINPEKNLIVYRHRNNITCVASTRCGKVIVGKETGSIETTTWANTVMRTYNAT